MVEWLKDCAAAYDFNEEVADWIQKNYKLRKFLIGR